MRAVLLTAVLMATVLAGCAEGDYLGMPAGAGPQPPAEDNVTAGPDDVAPPADDPEARQQGTFLIGVNATNVSLEEAFAVELNFYYPGREPTPAHNSTGNSTGNSTTPADPGTPAYHDDIFWVVHATLGNLSLSFNGTSVPAAFELSLNQTGNATLAGHIILPHNETVHAEPVVVDVREAAGGGAVGSVFPWAFEADAVAPCFHCFQAYNVCVGMNAGASGADCAFADVPEGSDGLPITIEASNGFVSVDFMTACDGSGSGVGNVVDHEGAYTTIVPAGTTCIVLYETLLPDNVWTGTIG